MQEESMAQLLLQLSSGSISSLTKTPPSSTRPQPRATFEPMEKKNPVSSASKLSISFLVDATPAQPAEAEPSRTELKRKKRQPTTTTTKTESDTGSHQLHRPVKRARPSPPPIVPSAASLAHGVSSSALPTIAPSSAYCATTATAYPAYPAAFFLMPHPFFTPQLLSSMLLSHPIPQSVSQHPQQHQHQHALLRPIPHPLYQRQQTPAPSPLYPASPMYQPMTPPGHSSASSPPSSPILLLSSSPSSPLSSCSATTTSSSQARTSNSATERWRPAALETSARPSTSSAVGDLSSGPNPSANNNNDDMDVQQHTQQLLKQWHRQRQVQKLLYLRQKKHKQLHDGGQAAVAANSAHPARSTINATIIPPVPTFHSAASGQPSSLTAETLMALIDELLGRHVSSTPPPPPPLQVESSDHHQDKSKRRHRVPPEHLQVLEEVFAAEPFPHAEAKDVLARRLGMTKRSITIWFQNKRARLKRSDGDDDDEIGSTSPKNKSSSPSSRSSSGSKSDGIVFHQLTVDTTGHLTIIPEFPLDV